MTFEMGAIVGGKVTGITKFGAFVALDGEDNVTGLVHISEVAHSYVNDIAEHLKVGQQVKVKIMSIGDGGKVGLSIKKATEPPAGERSHDRPQRQFNDRPQRQFNDRPQRQFGDRPQRQFGDRSGGNAQPFRPAKPAEPETFEDRLSKFMQDSNKNLSGSKMFSEKKSRRRGRD